jgi:hypothetical protein
MIRRPAASNIAASTTPRYYPTNAQMTDLFIGKP